MKERCPCTMRPPAWQGAGGTLIKPENQAWASPLTAQVREGLFRAWPGARAMATFGGKGSTGFLSRRAAQVVSS